MSQNNHTFLDKLILFLATGFYSGYAPKAPGTVGSLVAIAPFFLLQQLPIWGYILAVTVAILIGIAICHMADQLMQSHDNKAIVWDEFCGLWIALFMLPDGWHWILIGFVLFRFFDIIKPFPISWLDKRIEGGLGVMIDDVVAGLFALIGIQLLVYFTAIPVT